VSESLVQAARDGDLERATALVDAGLDPNERNEEGSVPLYGVGDAGAARILIAVGADPNLESTAESEGLPLCMAACWGDFEMASALLEGGADPNRCENGGTGSSPLTWAARGGHVETIEVLLRAGADPSLADGTRMYPLVAATQQGSARSVRALLGAGADPFVRRPDGLDAMDIAEEWSVKDIEAELRSEAALFRKRGQKVVVDRAPVGDGTDRVSVFVGRRGSGMGFERETGFAQISEMLRDARSASS